MQVASFFASHNRIFSTSLQREFWYFLETIRIIFLEMKMQDITLFGLLLPAIPLNMVAVNFRYTALASLIRQIHEMAKQTTDYSRPPAILYREMQILQTRIKFVKFSLFFAGLSFFFNLLSVGLHILEVYTASYGLFVATLSSLSIAVLLFLYEISRSTEALSLHIADIHKSGN